MSSVYYRSKHWKELRAAFRRIRIGIDGGMCQAEGCEESGGIADHIATRPDVPYPTPADRLDNLRWLCRSHDSQVREQRHGAAASRKQGGNFRIKGCDASGRSLDPRHRWNK